MVTTGNRGHRLLSTVDRGKGSTMDTIISMIRVCQCCLLTHANGECCADDQHGGDGIEPLSEIGDGYTVTMGMLAEEHADGCSEDTRESGDCECEQLGFSWSRCEGCGSCLGGNRYALTLWRINYVLWGSHPWYAAGTPIKIMGGTLDECKAGLAERSIDEAWDLDIRPDVAVTVS